MFETRIGEIKRVRLTDGSLITLDTNSLVAVAFSPSSRQVRLVRGRARFDVAHAPRPFQVVAGTGIITAHGTVFDVSKGRHDIIAVRLLRGAVDVRLLPAKGGRSDAKRLMPGQSLAFRSEFLPSAPGSPASGKNWPDALAEFDNSPLGLVVEEANRYTAMPIILEGEGLDKVKISGLFRITDSELLAARIARLLNLDLVRYPGRIVLRRR
jgi:transmembrane sensor